VRTARESERFSIVYASGEAENACVLRLADGWSLIAEMRESGECRIVAEERHVGCELGCE
jgi:hypothetical protein